MKSLTLKKKIGATISFPEGLENTPFFICCQFCIDLKEIMKQVWIASVSNSFVYHLSQNTTSYFPQTIHILYTNCSGSGVQIHDLKAKLYFPYSFLSKNFYIQNLILSWFIR